MPGYIIGRNELITEAKALVSGSNAVVLSIVLGSQPQPGTQPSVVTDLRDVARVHVEALDEKILKVGAGESKSFLLDGGSATNGVELNDAKAIVRKTFPDAVKEGKLKVGGGFKSAGILLESSETVTTFGEMHNYEEMVKELVAQYLELSDREQGKL
jgi:hypothetical protein